MQVLIVGGGVIGLLSALELSRAGCQVTVLDKAQHGRAASWAGGGILSPLYPWRYMAPVNQLAGLAPMLYSTLAIELLEATGIDIEVHRCGMMILDTDDSRDAVSWFMNQPVEAPKILNSQALRSTNPRLAHHYQHALWCPSMSNLRNPHLIKALIKHLEQRGVKLIRNTQVMAFEKKEALITAVIDQHGTRWIADQYVIASGAWSGQLTDLVGVDLPVQPVKGQMILYKTPPRWLPCMVMNRGVYLIPRIDGHVLCGSTIEQTGFDDHIDDAAQRHLADRAIEMVPELAGMVVRDQWAGLRPAAPNGIPYIGRAPHTHNLWVNAGHFRNGIVLAPGSARILREQMLGLRTTVSASPYQFSQQLLINMA
jgi:glycine oxidase